MLEQLSDSEFPNTMAMVSPLAGYLSRWAGLSLSVLSVVCGVCVWAADPVVHARQRSGCRTLMVGSGVAAGGVLLYETVVLAAAYVSAIWRGDLWEDMALLALPAYTFWVGALLTVTCGLAWLGTGDRRFITALFWLFIMASTCMALGPGWDSPSATWGDGLSTVIPLWVLGAAVALGAFVLAEGWFETRRRYRLMWENPSALSSPRSSWPLIPQSALAVGVGLILLSGLHLARPAAMPWGGYRLSSLAIGIAGVVAGAALFALANREWRAGLADVAQGLLAVGVCGFAAAFLAQHPAEVMARMPAHLNAVLIGLSLMTGFWCWLSGVWAQQLDAGEGWTTAGRIVGLTPRYSTGTGLLALFVAVFMSCWPRLEGMAHSDATFGRIAMGVAGHLLLVLALLVCGRRWKRVSFFVLAGGATVSLVVFVIVRAAEFVTVVR